MDALIVLGFFFGVQPLILWILGNYSIHVSKVENDEEEL